MKNCRKILIYLKSDEKNFIMGLKNKNYYKEKMEKLIETDPYKERLKIDSQNNMISKAYFIINSSNIVVEEKKICFVNV